MKKIFTLSLALAICASVYADAVKVLDCGAGIPGIDEPQLMGLGISPNGQYVCGAIENGVGFFIADTQSGDVKWLMGGDDGGELRHVDNKGEAVGFTDFGLLYKFESGEDITVNAPEGYRYVLCEDITEDGSMLVGSLAGQSFATEGAFSKDGGQTWTLLPIPTKEELGEFSDIPDGSAAKYVSADGKVIFGFLGSFIIPILWVLNDNGEYEADFFPARYIKTSADNLNDDTKPLLSISAMYLNMSNNGKYLSMLGMMYNQESGQYMNVPVIYDTEARDIIIYKEQQEIDDFNLGLYPTAICDNGMFIGSIGQPFFQEYGTFIMKSGQTKAEKMIDAFPAFNAKFGESDKLGFNMPTGLSADGRYLLGYTYYCDDYNDEGADAYYVTYIIDANGDASVNDVTPDGATAVPEAFFSIDGRILNGMNKGLNIIRMSDGTARKVIVK